MPRPSVRRAEVIAAGIARDAPPWPRRIVSRPHQFRRRSSFAAGADWSDFTRWFPLRGRLEPL
jgi:hypothetical protein